MLHNLKNKLVEKRMDEEQESCDQFFDGIKDTLFFQMHRIHIVIFRLANKYFLEEEFPIKSEQFPVLISIYKCGNCSQQEIANHTCRDKSSVQRTILALQKKGLVTISPSKTDKRKNLVSTTEEGAKIALKLKNVIRKVEEEIMEIFDAEIKLNHIHSLKVIADNLEQLHKCKY